MYLRKGAIDEGNWDSDYVERIAWRGNGPGQHKNHAQRQFTRKNTAGIERKDGVLKVELADWERI